MDRQIEGDTQAHTHDYFNVMHDACVCVRVCEFAEFTCKKHSSEIDSADLTKTEHQTQQKEEFTVSFTQAVRLSEGNIELSDF